MTNSIKGIIFDLYGVNVHRDEQRTLEAIAQRTGSCADKVRRSLEESGRDSLKLGQITQRRFVSRLNKRLNTNLTTDELTTLWNSTLSLGDGMTELLKRLQQRYPLYLLSNLNAFDWRDVSRLDLIQYFEDLFLSFELGLKKPNPAFFQEVINLTGIDAHNFLFIDDQMKNVTAASQLGMQSIQFKDSQTLHHQLHRLGIL